MHDSDYIEKNYRESIRRNRRERWDEFKRNYGSGGSMSGGEAIFAVIFTLALFVGVPGAVLYFHNRKADVPDKRAIPDARPIATSASVTPVLRPAGEAMPVPFPKKADTEMSRKYGEIVKKKQRLYREMDGYLKEYNKHCLKEPLSGARRRLCDRIDRKNQETYRKLKKLKY